MNALTELTRIALEDTQQRHPNLPAYALPRPRYSDKDANGLTRCIIDYVRLSGGYATRINTMGLFDPHTGKWRKSGSTKGTADIHACLLGKHLSIEVKAGRDRMSEHQESTRHKVEQSGGLYFEARSFQSFYEWLHQNFKLKH
jgi:hypothetical protein